MRITLVRHCLPCKEEIMEVRLPPTKISSFMLLHIPEFSDRFGISYTIDGPQLEYFVYEKKTGLDISCSMTLSHDAAQKEIRVMTFYPGICLQQECRYLSSVCFLFIPQLFAAFNHFGSDNHILINTRNGVYDTFYARLQDFNFQILQGGEEDRTDLQGNFPPLILDTSMFSERPLPLLAELRFQPGN